MDITYRKLQYSDLEIYHEIRLQCLYQHPNNFGTTYEEQRAGMPFKFDTYLKNQDPNNFIMGAFEKEKCIGICGFIREQGKRRRHRGCLIQIYIIQEFQKLGIGRQLIATTVAEVFDHLDVEQIILGVITENDQASKVYENLGFEEYAVFRNYLKLEEGYLDQRMMIKHRPNV